MEIQGQVRLFANLDTAKSAKSEEKGVYARDLDSFKGIKKAIAYIFGSTVDVGGKTYVVSAKSFNAFKDRNPALGVKSFNWSQVSALLKKDSIVQLPMKKTPHAPITAKELQAHQPELITKKTFTLLMGPKGLGLSEKDASQIAEKFDTSKPIKEQLPSLLKDHIAHLPHQEKQEMKDLIAWIKNPSGKTEDNLVHDIDTPDTSSTDKKPVNTGVCGRLTEAHNAGTAINGKDNALNLLGKIVTGKDGALDPSIVENRKMSLKNYREEVRTDGVGNTPAEQKFFDDLIVAAGFKIEKNGDISLPHASPKKT